jgi:hypothetical protein
MAETGKKRTARIPLDYYKHPDRLAKWRLLLSAAAVLIATGWAFGLNWDFWSTPRREERARRLASHGPLARSHATWETQCEACHAPFRPIGQASWATPIFGDSSQSNGRCQACHAAPIHHASQSPKDLACAGCHHDHKGPDASLVRMTDQHCTRCHANLTASMSVDRAPICTETVTHFDANPSHHPEFRTSKNSDQGRLAFDHARHMTQGMAAPDGGPVQTLSMLGDRDRARYQRYAQGAEGVIQLDCAACHQLDNGGSIAARGSGAYMLPVTYENQCRACHPLDFDPAAPDRTMAHPLQPAEVHESLWETYAAEYLGQNPGLLDRRIAPRPLPGQAEPTGQVEARHAIERKVGNAETVLFGAKKCGECHQYETGEHEPVASLGRWDPEHEVRVAPTNVPAVWWRSAAFQHSAHRGVSCKSCHERAYPDHSSPSRQSRDVLLPGINDCLECHGPRRTGGGEKAVSGGAGFNCTECHRYHNADATLSGLNNPDLAPEARSTIEQFLLGTSTTAPAPAAARP